jgi:hypothetical protein
MNGHHISRLLAVGLMATFLPVSGVMAQAPAPAPSPGMALTAVSANVNGAGEKIEFFINRWSSDADRDKLTTAWSVTPTAPRAGGAPEGSAAAPAGRAGGGAARGGRGGARGGDAPAAPRTPEGSLLNALRELPAAGYFWTSEVGGYVIHYAYRLSQPDGGSRIILMTDKRLGVAKDNWKSPAASPNTYEFTVIELRLPAKGGGEGKASLTGTLVVEPGAAGVTLATYSTLPVTLRDVSVRPNS